MATLHSNKNDNTNLQQALKEAMDYRLFLLAYLKHRSMNLSDFARASGFAHGFPGDVISGRRRLTAKSYPAFEKALKIPTAGRQLFRYLVAKEESDIFP